MYLVPLEFTLNNHASSSRLPAKAVSEPFVLSKLQFLMDIGIWPGRDRLDYHGWLRNFHTIEKPFALNMLNVFLYYNESLVDALFRRAVNQLSAAVTQNAHTLSAATHQWRQFLQTMCVTYVEGEQPNPTDSGLLFARKARQILGIAEEQIGDPKKVVYALLKGRASTILLLDDFIGSGQQTVTTWFREHSFEAEGTHSFARASTNGVKVFYVPLLATTYGLEAISRDCPRLSVHPAHVLNCQYSLTDPDSVLWPLELQSDAATILYSASLRAGIVHEYGECWSGFHKLALPVAFSHSIPDATLPLFYWDKNGWTPLIRRT